MINIAPIIPRTRIITTTKIGIMPLISSLSKKNKLSSRGYTPILTNREN
jgi:hypothetical protein